MKTGKISESILKRSVLRQLDPSDPLCRERYGADSSSIFVEGGTAVVFSAVNTVPGFESEPEKLIIIAANNLAASGAVPKAVMLHVTLPEDCEESVLKQAMKKIKKMADQYQMEVLGGHTEVSDAVKRPLFSVTGIGIRKETSDAGCTTLEPGQELVLTRWIALAGTAALAIQKEQELLERFPFQLIDSAKGFEQYLSVVPEALLASQISGTAVHDLSQGGILGALWEMAEHADVGLEINLKSIPVKQETIEICELYDINPYYFYSAGSLLIGTHQPQELLTQLETIGVSGVVIGRVTEGNERVIRNGEEIRYLDRPAQDEWYRRRKN